MKKIELIVENARPGEIWGRVNFEDNLLVEKAENIERLQSAMRVLLEEFQNVKAEEVEFEIFYDLTSFFEVFSYLNISKIAAYAGINASLLRHYAAGSKTAGKEQIQKLQVAIHRAGKDLTAVSFGASY